MSTGEAPASQFDDLRQQQAAGLLGMWTFLATEVLLFGSLLVVFLVWRAEHAPTFAAAAARLDLPLATVNTVVLLTSGLTMALAEHAATERRRRMLVACLGATVGLGTLFLGVKGFEWYREVQHQLVPLLGLTFHFPEGPDAPARLFFGAYFVLTGLHAAHMVLGLVLLTILAIWSLRHGSSGRLARGLRLAGLYWAFVDVVWILVFTLLYLLRA